MPHPERPETTALRSVHTATLPDLFARQHSEIRGTIEQPS
jgi:hypothetical protein